MRDIDEKERPAEFVQALERGVAVLRAFTDETPKLTMTEVAERTGMTKAAARRFLITLAGLGYAQFDGRSYSLRPRALEIGGAYLSSIHLPSLATPHLEVLAGSVRETSSLTVLDGTDVVYVARVHGHRIMSVSIKVGTRFPALLTSTGRVMLTDRDDDELLAMVHDRPPGPVTARTIREPERILREIQKARDHGYAITDQELDLGLRSIAVPIHAADGGIIAAVNVSAHTSRASVEALRKETLPALTAAARTIEKDLVVAFPDGLPEPLHRSSKLS
jgi:IclR family pca regulon transcriptional regulator